MPKLEKKGRNNQEKNSLYPQRAFENVGQLVDEIQKIISGEIPKIELNTIEKENLINFERSLIDKLETAYKIIFNLLTTLPENNSPLFSY